MRLSALAPLLAVLVTTPACAAQTFPVPKPVEPFRIAGNLYYVGTSDVTAYLFTTPEGHVLLDGGYEQNAPHVRASIEKLGFKIGDVKILLNSHAHLDHAGGLAALKGWSGATLVASEKDAPLLARGGIQDHVFGDRLPFPPVEAGRLIRDGDTVVLGGTTLTAHVTAGHTPGCTTWTATVEEGGKPLRAVFICSASVLPEAKLVGNERYPNVATDFAKTFATFESLPVDLFLASHASFFDLEAKSERLRRGETPNPFIDPAGYKEYVAKAKERFEKVLAEQKGAAKGRGA